MRSCARVTLDSRGNCKAGNGVQYLSAVSCVRSLVVKMFFVDVMQECILDAPARWLHSKHMTARMVSAKTS